MNYRIFPLISLILFALLSCKQNSINPAKSSNIDSTYFPKYAKYYSLYFSDSVYQLDIIDPWNDNSIIISYKFSYLLEGQSNNNADFISLPIKSASVHSLDYIGFLDELNASDIISSITDGNRVYNQKLRDRIESKKLVDLGPAIDFNLEKLIVTHPDIILSTSYNQPKKSDEILKKIGIPILYNLGWMENSPLGRAEWIKVIGLITGKYEEADSIFSSIEHNYLKAKNQVSEIDIKPRVFVGADYNGIWYMPGGESFKAQLLRDAGADYQWFGDQTKGSLALSFESVLSYHIDDEFWIEVPWKTMQDIKINDPRYMNFKAYKNSKVFNNFGKSDELANDYWETGLCRPDLIILDLIEIFHPQLFEHQLIYYKSLQN